MHFAYQLYRHGELLSCFEKLILAQSYYIANLLLNLAHVAHSLYHVASARFALSANHRGALSHAAQSLAQVARAAYKGHVKSCFVDVIHIVSRGEHLRLVDVVNLDSLEHLSLNNVANTALGHYRNGDSLLNAANHSGVAHA